MATISDYEALRASNVERNSARLRELGLISAKDEQTWKDNAWRRTPVKKAKSEKKRKENVTANDNGSRKSMRLQGKSPEIVMMDSINVGVAGVASQTSLTSSEGRVRKKCRKIGLHREVEMNKADLDMATLRNRTASYEHCRMRIITMTHNGLANRIKAIERAAGDYCVLKMATFKICLEDEGLLDLAELAAAALERLKALKSPPPMKDEEDEEQAK